MDFKRIKLSVVMFFILSFQGLLNFGNSCNITKFQVILQVQLLLPDSDKCEQYKPYDKRLLIIYRGVGMKERRFPAQRIILANFEIVLNVFE